MDIFYSVAGLALLFGALTMLTFCFTPMTALFRGKFWQNITDWRWRFAATNHLAVLSFGVATVPIACFLIALGDKLPAPMLGLWLMYSGFVSVLFGFTPAKYNPRLQPLKIRLMFWVLGALVLGVGCSLALPAL